MFWSAPFMPLILKRTGGIYACLIIVFSLEVISAVRLNAPRILLPYNRNGGLPTNYTLRIQDDEVHDCYEWRSVDRNFVEVEPISNKPEDCSEAAIVSIVSSYTERKITKIIAKGRTGIQLECEVIVDFPHKIELVSTTDELAVDTQPETVFVVAKDRFGHQFTSINGLKFEWSVEEELGDGVFVTSTDNNVVRLNPQTSSPVDGWVLRGLLGHSVLVEPINVGLCKIRASTRETENVELSTQEVKLHISSNVRVLPSSAFRLLRGGTVRLGLNHVLRGDLEYQKDFTVSQEDSKIVQIDENDGAVTLTGLEYGEAHLTVKSIHDAFPSIDVNVEVVKPSSLEIKISRGGYKILEEHKIYHVSIELFDENRQVIYPSDNLKIAVSFPNQLFYINSTTSNGTCNVVKALKPGKAVIKAEMKGIYLKDGTLSKEYELQNSLTVTVCQKIQIFPPLTLLPSDSLRNSSHEIRLMASGGTGRYHWATNNAMAAAISYDKEKSHAGYLQIKKEGDFTVIITDEENVNFLASAKVSIQPVIDVETYPTVVEADIGNVLILPVAFLAYEDKERKIIRKFDDCSKVQPKVEIIEKHVFSYDKDEPHVPAFGKGCQTLQFRCMNPGHSRINVFYEPENGNATETHKTTTVLSCFKSIKPVHPVRVAVLPLGSSVEVAFEGGPRKWPLYKTGHYQNLEGSNPKLLDISLVRDPIRYNKDLTVFRVICKSLGEDTLIFRIGNEPSATNPHPAKAETSIKIVCSHPQSVHLKLSQKPNKKLKKDNIVKVPFYGEKVFSVDIWLKDSMGRKLYNISSLDIQFSLSDNSLAGVSDSKKGFTTHSNGAAGYNKISRDFKELKLTGGTGKLVVKAEVLGYRKDVLEKLEVNNKDELKTISGSIDLELVSLRDIHADMYAENDEEKQEEETCDGDSCKER